MSAPFPLPALRTLAALPPREADVLLSLAEHFYRLHLGQSIQQGLRREAAYRGFLKLSSICDEPENGAADSNSVAERRKAPRRDVFRLGELQPVGWSYPLDCLVRDASAHGALIEVGWTKGLPDDLTLTVQSIGLNERCQVVRRTARCLGVTFTTP